MDRPEPRPTPLPPEDAMVDEASDESFPASDPPSYPAISSSPRERVDDDADAEPPANPTEAA